MTHAQSGVSDQEESEAYSFAGIAYFLADWMPVMQQVYRQGQASNFLQESQGGVSAFRGPLTTVVFIVVFIRPPKKWYL